MRLSILFALFFVTSSSQSGEMVCAPSDSPLYDSHCSERLIINKYPKLFSRVGNNLVIHLLGEKNRTFADAVNEGQPSYWLIDYLPKISSAVILINSGESSRKFLVNTNSGEITKIGGSPLLSPDGEHLLVYGMEIEFNFENYFAVYRVTPDKLEVEFDAGSADHNGFNSFSEWGPSDVRWLSPTEVVFNKTILDCATGCGSGFKYKKVQKKLILDTKAKMPNKWNIE